MAKLLSKAAAAGLFSDGEEPEEELYLWPENVPAWEAFIDLRSQWSEGILHYADVVAHLRETFPDDEERREVYAGVRACEHAARAVHAEHRKRQQQQKGSQ